jgi:chromosome segregation ATPase
VSTDDRIADLNERLSAQESHYEGIRAAIFELRRDVLNRASSREADVIALRQQGEDLRQRTVDLEKFMANGFAEVHRSFQMLIDRRDITLLQRSVDETMKRVQSLAIGQQELKQDVHVLQASVHDLDARQQELRQQVQELQAGQQELRQQVQELQAGQQELRQQVQELQAGQQELRQNVQELRVGQQELRQQVQELQAGQQELRQNVQELQAGQRRIEQTLQQILVKLN